MRGGRPWEIGYAFFFSFLFFRWSPRPRWNWKSLIIPLISTRTMEGHGDAGAVEQDEEVCLLAPSSFPSPMPAPHSN